MSRAVERGLADGRREARPSRADLALAERLARTSAEDEEAGERDGLRQVLALVERFPASERLQLLAARMIEATRDPRRPPLVWKAIWDRFPGSAEAFRLHLRWTTRLSDVAHAIAIIEARFPEPPTEYSECLVYARGCDEVKLYDQADAAFEAAIALAPRSEEAYRLYVQSLQARGSLLQANRVLERADEAVEGSDALAKLRMSIRLDLHHVGALRFEAPLHEDDNVSNAVLTRLLQEVRARRSGADRRPRSFIGSVVMISGSLGSGGAERQLANTAIGLQRCIEEGRPLQGLDVMGPVTVCVRALKSRVGGDFYQPMLEAARVPVWEYSALEAYGGEHRLSRVREISDLVRFLPPQMAEGTERLTDVLAAMKPDVVHIWQDGSILAAGLAALMAEVPQIVLSVRTVPPIDRPSRMKPQYSVLYPEMLRMPGVVLTANSHFAARRYAEWLGVDPAMVPVIHNGLEPLPVKPLPRDLELFAEFERRTAAADFTVGSVMRFDENKRPYLWLDCAAALLERAPSARFILVGEGPLLPTAREYAAQLGIAERVLFVGRSPSVGYWLTHLDAFLLLSQYEGLPNVLIEAQFAGVPVYTTPAGGAAETVLEGQTGHVFAEGERLDPREVAAWLDVLRVTPAARAAIKFATRQWVETAFTVERMLEGTASVYVA